MRKQGKSGRGGAPTGIGLGPAEPEVSWAWADVGGPDPCVLGKQRVVRALWIPKTLRKGTRANNAFLYLLA